MNLRRYNYRGMGEWLKGADARSLVQSKGNEALMFYQAIVAKRSGRLARSARVTTRIGGVHNDRWQSTLTVDAPYAAAHEFGTDDGDEQIVAGHQDLQQVLAMLKL